MAAVLVAKTFSPYTTPSATKGIGTEMEPALSVRTAASIPHDQTPNARGANRWISTFASAIGRNTPLESPYRNVPVMVSADAVEVVSRAKQPNAAIATAI